MMLSGLPNPNPRGCLKSCAVGRQWPQTRLKVANLSSHGARTFCLHDKIEMIRISAAAGKEGHDWFIDLAEGPEPLQIPPSASP